MKIPIYLDYNATTPVDPLVASAMIPYLEQQFGNPSSMHAFGIEARKGIEKARRQVADLLNCHADEIVFTSGGTESNNYAIKGFAFQHKHKGNHIITTTIEHPAVSEVCAFLEEQGFTISYVEADAHGMVDPARIEEAVTPQTILISVMHANNEVGTIQAVREISEIARKHQITFHTDAAQSAGKIPADVRQLGVDLLSLAGHKMYAPKGVGALFIRRGISLQKLMHGAGHEHNLRAGTENVAQIVGMGQAAEMAMQQHETHYRHMKSCRDLLFNTLKNALPEISINGHPEHRLPNTLNVGFPGLTANTLLDELNQVAASAGAACHTPDMMISPVLSAMKVPTEIAMGSIRFSTGRFTTTDEIKEAAKQIIGAVQRLRPQKPKDDPEDPKQHDGTIKLTRYTHGMGCACKIRPQYLEKLLKDFAPIPDERVITGPGTSDDAAVFRIRDDMAIVQTLDFFTPIVDDPYHFGAIAAANALSDIYAMGATPLFALNIVGFPSNRLPMQVLKDILRGASDKAAEAWISVLGGHTIEDNEPKYGMVVTGTIHPDKVITNAGAKPGDALILTKPIGTGIISTAAKRGLAEEQTAATAIHVMSQLNDQAAGLMKNFPTHACTDITGFGLLGHMKEMSVASAVNIRILSARVPLIEGTYDLAVSGAVPGGTINNLEFVSAKVQWPEDFPIIMKQILCDAQTSGGLLIAMPQAFASSYISQLETSFQKKAWIIGLVTMEGDGTITVE